MKKYNLVWLRIGGITHLVLLSLLLHPHNVQKPHLCLHRAGEKAHHNQKNSSPPSKPTGTATRRHKKLPHFMQIWDFWRFLPSWETGYCDRCRIREAMVRMGWTTAKSWIRRRCWRAAPTPKTMGKSKCEVLTWRHRGKRLGKGHEKRQEAKSRLI